MDTLLLIMYIAIGYMWVIICMATLLKKAEWFDSVSRYKLHSLFARLAGLREDYYKKDLFAVACWFWPCMLIGSFAGWTSSWIVRHYGHLLPPREK